MSQDEETAELQADIIRRAQDRYRRDRESDALRERVQEMEYVIRKVSVALRAAASRARQYAHDAKTAGHLEAAEGFYEIAGRIDGITEPG